MLPDKTKNLAIIPARGGSKRIPEKNIKLFFGKPIIAYSIEAALASDLFDEVMVSTDNLEIAAIAQKYGAKVPFIRSFRNSDDNAGLNDVFFEVLNYYQDQGMHFTNFCGILSTAPFIEKEYLQESFSLLNEMTHAVIPVVKYDFPIERYLMIEDEILKVGDRDNYGKRSQDLPERFHDAGQFYWANCESFLLNKGFFKLMPKAYRLNRNVFQDIDTLDDWERIEMIYQFLNMKKKPSL
ncbi:pseudaminic acid cytidylyltransferase [Albibacterium bauzanense]|uniref:N-acylneuraminate cytidylyltransferase n=1 Tax=Albibacterium bauzanense TaxID=653929 RepID=A0A4R1LZY6_9SPHI|nr:pseudaminic acid cytidylyltransferase [Albibacterium bauzanense]TCK84915.1 N-acylneuraminate cytidylyltransferase [Albibacterium bauzanense]